MLTIVDEINAAAARVIDGSQLILYAVTPLLRQIIRQFAMNSIYPACICDIDENKQGKKYFGVEVIAPEAAFSSSDETLIFIASENTKATIIGSLIHEYGIAPERILNYEEVEKRRSCTLLDQNLVIQTNENHRPGLSFCCNDFGKAVSPFTVYKTQDYRSLLRDFIAVREHTKNLFMRNAEAKENCSCFGCRCIETGYFFKHAKIRDLNFSTQGGCNFRCIYCGNDAKRPPRLFEYDIDLKELLDTFAPHLANNCLTFLNPGEITLHPKKAELYEAICDRNVQILTNASIYDNRISDILSHNSACLNISIDAGTRETYANVKGYDCFEKVIDNIKRYAIDSGGGSILLKYIFLEDINDNAADVDGFMDLAREFDCGNVLVSSDIYKNYASDKTLSAAKYMIEQADALSVPYTFFSDTIKEGLSKCQES
jgi:wyosine [tRNA(Phe)-imidazoG37] synthetase (radical SAM superfamily)